MVTEMPHDLPDRGPDIVVTAPQPIAFITIADLEQLEGKFTDKPWLRQPFYVIGSREWYEWDLW